MSRSIPIWIADSPDYTQGQEAWDEDGGGGHARAGTGGGTREGARGGRSADGGEQPGARPENRPDGGGEALQALRDQIEEVGRGKEPPTRVVLGQGDRGIAIRFGAVHEMCQVEGAEASCTHARGGDEVARSGACGEWRQGRPGSEARPSRAARSRYWTPPLTLLAAVACEAMRTGAAARLVWIGRRVFPYPVFLARQHPSWLAASLFVDVRERDARVWAIDVALRSGVATCVVADGQGITLAESRRLQVAAKCGRGVALLARPWHEAAELSAAATRWMVTPKASHASDESKTRVAWTLTLVRSKGESLGMDAGSLIAEWRDAQGLVVVPALVASRADRKAADAAS